jgi:hypothetical protein
MCKLLLWTVDGRVRARSSGAYAGNVSGCGNAVVNADECCDDDDDADADTNAGKKDGKENKDGRGGDNNIAGTCDDDG